MDRRGEIQALHSLNNNERTMGRGNTFLKNTIKVNPRGLSKKLKRGRAKKTERQSSVLLVIALAVGFTTISYSIIGFHDYGSNKSSASFEPPLLRDFKQTRNERKSIRTTLKFNGSHERIDGKKTDPKRQLKKKGTRLFFKYDTAGPKPIPGSARSHALSNAVPPTNTIPVEHAENKSYHISQRTNTSLPLSMKRMPEWGKFGRFDWNHTYHNDFRTLYLYNPSIIPLHNTISHNSKNILTDKNHYFEDPDALSEADLLALTGGDPSVRYVSTFRAYLGCNCFGRDKTDRTLMTAGEQISYLAIALLDERLDVVEGTDVLIDLNAGPGRGVYERQFVEDCRIFLIKGGTYLLCNEEMRRIQITRTPKKKNKKTSQSRTFPPPGYGTKRGIQPPYEYPNVHGDGLNITLLAHHGKIAGGKNFNIFRTIRQDTESNNAIKSTTEGSSKRIHEHLIQVFPNPHKYRKIYFPDATNPENKMMGPTFKDPVSYQRSEEEIAPQVRDPPKASFDTPDTLHNITTCPPKDEKNCTAPLEVSFFEAENDHGTACCVVVFLPQDEGEKNGDGNHGRGKEVMVGISHKKLSPRDNFWLRDIHRRYDHFGIDRFVSRFVAYDIDYPFDVVALSGWFCLGFANDPVELSHPHKSTLAGKNTNFRLDLFDDVYDCPVIHFASGFSEVVGNSSRAIIGYGVNDCHPRMFEVEKDEIVRMLMTG